MATSRSTTRSPRCCGTSRTAWTSGTSASTIDQPLPTLDSGALVWLDMVSASSDRELLLRIKSPDGKTTKSQPLLQGTKLRLVTYLEAPSTPKLIIEAIDELKQR